MSYSTTRHSFVIVFICLLFRGASAYGQAPEPEPINVSGTSAIMGDWRKALIAAAPKTDTFGTIKASAAGAEFVTTRQPEFVYSLQAVLRNQESMKKGDTLFIRFAARSVLADITTGVTKLRVGFSRNAPPWESSYNGELGLSSAWQRFDIPFTCQNDFKPNEAKLYFMYGYPAQIAEIADVQFIRFGSEVDLASLPKTKRFADPVKPEVLASETARIAKLRAELAAVADPSPARGRTLLVSTQGKSSGDGSSNSPFASIQKALARARPGDTVLVGAGEYQTGEGL